MLCLLILRLPYATAAICDLHIEDRTVSLSQNKVESSIHFTEVLISGGLCAAMHGSLDPL